jgi:D-alanine transaminase
MNKVFLNGDFLPIEEARIPVLDRGFLFGDGVYEVIPAYAGRMFRLTEHLDRLNQSLRAIRMTPPMSHGEWKRTLGQLITQYPKSDLNVYLQVTRGADSIRDHVIPQGLAPTVFAMATPVLARSPDNYRDGVAAITLDDIRWGMCNIKAITLLANVLLKQEAVDNNALEAILIRDGLAYEGAASNVLIVRDETIVTPPKGPRLLPGITRDLILELAAEAGLPYRETDIPVEELEQAEEIWLSSSNREIMPVTRLNGKQVGDGKPGLHWRRITTLYQVRKDNLVM